jgi:hypothetical protein
MQKYTWFFSLESPISPEQERALQQDFDRFTAQWKTHGQSVDGLIKIWYQQFIVIQANPAGARPSGCSIDSLKRGVEQTLSDHGILWLDPAWIFYRDQQGEIRRTLFHQIPALVASGEMQGDTVVFDHNLGQSDDLSRWEQPMRATWLSRYLPKEQKA